MEQRNNQLPELTEAIRFQRDLYLYWREAHTANGLPLTARGYLTRAALRRVLAQVNGADGLHDASQERSEIEQARIFYLRRLLQRLGLLRLSSDATKLIAVNAEEMARYLAHTLAERLRMCTRFWVAGGWWVDYLDARSALPSLMMPAPPRIALARRRLLDQLARSADTPIDGAHSLAIKQPLMPAPTSGLVRSARQRKPITTDNEKDIWLAARSGPLLWMGLVAQKMDEQEQMGGHPVVGAYCPTLAALTLRTVDEQNGAENLPETSGRVIVQPNFEVIAFPPLTAPLLLLLDTCAERLALDQTARYRLTRQAFTTARKRHWSAEQICARLATATAMPLPENVRITLGDWERHSERVHLTQKVEILEVRNAALLDALLADNSMKPYIERRLTATAALLSAESTPRIRAWLLRRGELPAIVRAE